MSTLAELRSLLAKPAAPERGIVVALTDTQARIATPRGLVIAAPTAGLTIGQQVRINHGTAYPSPVASGRYRL